MEICLYDISFSTSIHFHCIYAGWIVILLLNLFLGKLAISSDPPFLWFWESWEIWEMSKFWCRWGRGGEGEEGTWKVLRNVIYCLLPPYSAFCISYVTQLSNIFPMRRRHGIILKGQCSLDKCFRNNFHDTQKLARVFHILALKESRNYPTTIFASNSCICTSKCGANQVRGSQVEKANMRKHFQTQKSTSLWPWYADLQIMR